jgi:hypothetical protein
VCRTPHGLTVLSSQEAFATQQIPVSLRTSFLRRGGSDCRLDTGIPFRPKAYPQAGLRSKLWSWSIIQGYKWHDDSDCHINWYELLAVFNTIRWRVRKAAAVCSRFLHLVDNQVCASILARGRSSSSKLRHTLRRLNALVHYEYAGGLASLAVGYNDL